MAQAVLSLVDLEGSYCVIEGTASLASRTTGVEFVSASSPFNWKVFVNSSFLISQYAFMWNILYGFNGNHQSVIVSVE